MKPVYVYRAALVRVVDGDSYEFDIDLGFRVRARLMIRLRNLYAAERGTPEGSRAAAIAEGLLKTALEIVVATHKTKGGSDVQTFARYVADIWIDGKPLQDALRAVLGADAGTGAPVARGRYDVSGFYGGSDEG